MDPENKHYVSSIVEKIIVGAIEKDLSERPHCEIQELMKKHRCDHIRILANNIFSQNQQTLEKH